MAVRYGWITVNPMGQVVKARALRREPDPPSSAEAARLVVAAFDQDDEWGVLVWLGMVTGMRAAASSPRCVGGTSTATRNRRTASRIRGRGRRRWHKDTKTHKMRRITLDVETSELAGDHFVFSADPNAAEATQPGQHLQPLPADGGEPGHRYPNPRVTPLQRHRTAVL
jgi:hypothetical protein